MFEEREELMISAHKNGVDEVIPKLRRAFFLKPTLNSTTLSFPKPPSISLSSKPNIASLKNMVSFKGRVVPLENWDTWVDDLQLTHEEIWKKVGIFDAIRASTYKIMNHNELIIGLAEKWCPETNTFLFCFGEATVTLEDVMILGGFSVLGECVKTRVRNREFEEIEKELVDVFATSGNDCDNPASHCDWMGFFKGFGGEFEHIAFLVLWLSRYVFPTNCYYGRISQHVFPIAISLARRCKIALAPAVLASIYRDLSLLKAKITDFVSGGKDNGSNLVLWAPLQLVQLWVWERFTILSPKSVSSHCGEPRLARWKNSRKAKNWLFRFEFESLGECFLWKPYGLFVMGRQIPELYCDEGRLVPLSDETSEELMSFARCLKPCELVGLDCIEQYLPHRVAMQFGFDQDIPCSISRSDRILEIAWSSYIKPLTGEIIYLSPRLQRGEFTARYTDWWRTESYHCDSQRRRSKRIAKKRSRNLDVYAGQHGILSTVCLSSSSNISDESSVLHCLGEMLCETSSRDKRKGNSCRELSSEMIDQVAIECMPSAILLKDNTEKISVGNFQDLMIINEDGEECQGVPIFETLASNMEDLDENVERPPNEISHHCGQRNGNGCCELPSKLISQVAIDCKPCVILSQNADHMTNGASQGKSPPPSSNHVVICENVPCRILKKVKFERSYNVVYSRKNKRTGDPPCLPSVHVNHIQNMDIGASPLSDRGPKPSACHVDNNESASAPLQSYPQSVSAEVACRMDLVSVVAEIAGRMSSETIQVENHTETGLDMKPLRIGWTNSEQSLANSKKETPTADINAVSEAQRLQQPEQKTLRSAVVTVDVEQGIAPAGGSLHDPLIIEDDKVDNNDDDLGSNSIIKAFENQNSDLEHRILEIERMLSVYFKNKNKGLNPT